MRRRILYWLRVLSKNSEIIPAPLCLGNVSKDFLFGVMKKD